MAVVILAVMPLCVANLLPQRVSDAFHKGGSPAVASWSALLDENTKVR